MFFRKDDDKTPQGKLARGCMYVVAVCALFLFVFGGLVPAIMWTVGETVETITDYSDCPAYHRCTPKGDWNDPDCKCWEPPGPTADQRYGCTVAQQAPNGECK